MLRNLTGDYRILKKFRRKRYFMQQLNLQWFSAAWQLKINGLSEEELVPILKSSREFAGSIGTDLQWFTPTCYNKSHPLN